MFGAPAGPGCGAGPLCVPVGGGPPASRLRRELRSARRREARPGPAAGHGHRSQALLRPPAPSTPAALWCCVADVPGQAPPPPFTPVRPGVLVCSERHLDAWTGPAAAHSTAAMPSGPSGVLHTGNAWSADVRLGVSPRSPARPRRRPTALRPCPLAPSGVLHTGGALGYRTKRVGFMVTFQLFGAEKSVLKLVGANLKDGLNVLVL